MQNFLDHTDVATIFLDKNLCIKRFTEPAARLISLRLADIDRPLSELATNIIYDELIGDGQQEQRWYPENGK